MISQDLLINQIREIENGYLSKILKCTEKHVLDLKNSNENFTTEEVIKICESLNILLSEIQN